jgi:hypothetical protein
VGSPRNWRLIDFPIKAEATSVWLAFFPSLLVKLPKKEEFGSEGDA